MIKVKAKEQPKWFQFRWRLSNLFMCIARAIYPENPEVTGFIIKMIAEQFTYGNAVTLVDRNKQIIKEKGE